jgi:hypothetical protein
MTKKKDETVTMITETKTLKLKFDEWSIDIDKYRNGHKLLER